MDVEIFASSPAGTLTPVEGGVSAFVPNPALHEFSLDGELVYELDIASRAVATLAGVGETLPNPGLLIAPFLRREAVLSSRIEGTQASISDLYSYEAGARGASSDAAEVSNYVSAMERGQALLAELPICQRLVNEIHMVLLTGVRGEDKRPGELRDRLVWIGPPGTPISQATFIPPPPDRVSELFSDWEKFANADLQMPPLLRCALMHYQFEVIHPYLDGNGRVGRLLIPLYLIASGVLPTPLLYLSAYLEQHRDEYYAHLLAVSATGAWRDWLLFFFRGVAEQAEDAVTRSRELRTLHESYRQRLQQKRASANTMQLVDDLVAHPVTTHRRAATLLDVTPGGARLILQHLADNGIVEALDTWPITYVAREVLDILR